MNIIAPSAPKIYLTKNHFLHWNRFKNQLSYLSKVKCPSDWPYNMSQNDNGTATPYFPICSCRRWHVTPEYQAVWALCLWDYLIAWHRGYFRSVTCWLFFISQVVNIFHYIVKSIQILCWWELCHSVPGDKQDLGYYSALKYPGVNHRWDFEI